MKERSNNRECQNSASAIQIPRQKSAGGRTHHESQRHNIPAPIPRIAGAEAEAGRRASHRSRKRLHNCPMTRNLPSTAIAPNPSHTCTRPILAQPKNPRAQNGSPPKHATLPAAMGQAKQSKAKGSSGAGANKPGTQQQQQDGSLADALGPPKATQFLGCHASLTPSASSLGPSFPSFSFRGFARARAR